MPDQPPWWWKKIKKEHKSVWRVSAWLQGKDLVWKKNKTVQGVVWGAVAGSNSRDQRDE